VVSVVHHSQHTVYRELGVVVWRELDVVIDRELCVGGCVVWTLHEWSGEHWAGTVHAPLIYLRWYVSGLRWDVGHQRGSVSSQVLEFVLSAGLLQELAVVVRHELVGVNE